MIDRLMIKDAMKRNGTSVNEVADKMGISRVTLSTHINGNPSTEVLLRIADAIGCPVTELFEQPKTGTASLSCPHCGKNINIKVE
ncbi:helix-turn-helix domain-containing protein [Bacteroides xylanisolvens]|uniref:Helix-turn-helix domain-containing protein n=1 Tax=Bacteroides xylanisolvens TaxID=371601 RepID=A0AAW4SLL1_9BACE|nr:helix-turn-helix transcriptional regulator [Bacteroides xylanisolvens]MCA4465854.1 helix-turn-helix domain-containing protein [Bacteroides xylanisolvens]MCA4470301.1 helix-turn-helix domain-containing protein [Bacteroides xylanisolvens]MCA4478215.1 helix-turn-helix domain-containing protein [Bacteroides xylanisolvens]MCA4487456.1 helix-turn-helix domain-containing protein [Bacteroides xylanisolvens]MCA4493112.1 helix-turn-helix domain-containing protein [Bacteroides xylanisolvens]